MSQPPNYGPTTLEHEIKVEHRSFLLQVILPLILGVIIVAAGILFVWQRGIATASAWADISLIFLLIPVFCLGLIPLAVVGALWYGFFKLAALLPGPLRKAKRAIDQAGIYMRTGTDIAVKPIFIVQGAGAFVSAFFKGLGSIIGIIGGESHE